jgi:hypothetical protein
VTRICIAAIFTVVIATPANAQTACDPPAAIGGALSFLILDTPVDPVPAGGGRFGLASTTGTGLEGSVHAMFPISPEWGVNVEAGTGRMAVVLERDASGESVNRRTGDDAAFHRITAGLFKMHAGLRSCTYAGVRLGLYRYSYQGVSLNAGGGAAFMGFNVPVTESGALFFELELSVGITKARAPLTPASVAPQIRPSIGYRYRF